MLPLLFTTAVLAGMAVTASPVQLVQRADPASVGISIAKEGGNSSLLAFGKDGGWGFMFEDINNSGDGGLYAEILQNRAFQVVNTTNQTAALYGWRAIDDAQISVVDTGGVTDALKNSLKVETKQGVNAAFENYGYNGIKIDSAWEYKVSMWAKLSAPVDGVTISVCLVTASGGILASQEITGFTSEWAEYKTTFTPSASTDKLDNTFVVTVKGAGDGVVMFSLFSLFPPTYKGRENGMRIDIAETIAAVTPTVWRFPGGNNLEGLSTASRWKWNETIGPLYNRPGRQGNWGYINTDGLGLSEYLEWTEDLGVTGIMGVWAGYSLPVGGVEGGETVAEGDLQPYIQAALDQIEYTLGDVSTSGGKLRAEHGHPEPFTNVKYIEIGNEDFFASESYKAYRWKMFHDAIKAAYPDLHIIATTYPETTLDPKEEYSDRHVYQLPGWFQNETNRYDNEPRPGPLIFEGEYAAISTNASDIYGTPATGRLRYSTLEAAVGEGAYMTMLERNSDIVFAASYAPMLENIDLTRQWSPNMILYDAGTVYPGVSYYTQKLFSNTRGDTILPVTASTPIPSTFSHVASSTSSSVILKFANYASDPVSLSLTLDEAFGTPKGASLKWSTTLDGSGDKTAQNVPKETPRVGIQEAEINVTGPVTVPAWTVGVIEVQI